MPPETTRPGPGFSQDDSRVGWLTGRRRRLTAFGVQPVGTGPHVFAGVSVEGAVAPTTGERFCLERPALHTARFPRGGDPFAQACPDSLTLLRLDTRGSHRAQRLLLPANVRRVF
jgi:putative transposase